MRVCLRHKRIGATLLGVALIAGCSSKPSTPAAPTVTATPPPTGLVPVAVQVDARLAQAPFDRPRQALVPAGWTLSVLARVPKARLAAWTPDGKLLISVPSSGEIVKLDAGGAAVFLDGLDQPHGMAFAGNTLYVAESDQVDAYDYVNGAAVNPHTAAAGLPDAKSPDLRGAYAHALKSVAVGRDGAVYFSIGSTGNITADDRIAKPPRASIMRVPPGGGPAAPFATGVRNGTGLAIAPDGSVWTAVNNRDNIADPETGEVDTDYVSGHPPESVARLTPGRELGWPYCNPDGGPTNLPLIRDIQTNADGTRLDCAALPPIEASLGAHAAPLGMSFTQNTLPAPFTSGALIGVHGSWNRQPPYAPEVAFFPWQNGDLGQKQTLVGGFQADDGTRWGRPVAAVAGPDGAVYITDDYADAVYRLAPR
ncbi:PQQ-dependent sugar dehydrogenase [Mycobacterium sp. NPDC048908]|uniref:PQQ-dependent sugar dehydrogenase n=1 Tax=Mycobacterium sp. NPDC048908 TaxID=3364292 RepID=UPI003716AC50